MAASAVIAASAIAASGTVVAATPTGLAPALIGFVGTIIGAAIAQGAALMIAHKGRVDAQQRDAAAKQHALRTLAPDARMRAHQGAFRRVKELLFAGRDAKLIDDADEWMDDNCLYLSGDARTAVWRAIGSARARASLLLESDNPGVEPRHRAEYHDQAMKQFNAIKSALEPIVRGADLPALGSDELDLIVANADRND
ncbi:hypothetical protein bAD24_p00815 (plasmid) [Burkholderia sp. AD24]|nr:hypothetical protein bAD24_p00815 [Burkholderia sp. AD24]